MIRLLPLLALPFGTAEAAEVRVAVVAGANHGLPGEEPLLYAHDEVERIAAMLTEIGGFADDKVHTVPAATPDRVAEALGRAVLDASAAREAGDTVTLLVYYTGHAASDGLHLGGEVLPLESLKTAARVVPADQRVFVVDACQSGQMFRSMGAALVDVRADDVPFTPPPNEAWITSSGPEEQSFEVDGRRGALFTHFFVSGTRGAADSDADGEVTLGEVFDFVAVQASAAAAGIGQVQRPRWGGMLGDLVIGDLDRARAGVDVVGPIAEPLLVVDLDDERVVAEIPAGAQGRMALPPGRYQIVSLPDRGRPQVAEATLRVGDFEPIAGTALATVSGVRTRGGVLVRHPWTVGASYLGAIGQTPGVDAAHGVSFGARREIGRGHALGVVVDTAGGSFATELVKASTRTTTALASWSFEAPAGRARLGPVLGLGGGWMDQTSARAPHPTWGAWYGDADRVSADFAVLAAMAGARASLPLDRWRLEVTPQVGLQTVFGDTVEARPVASLRVGVALGM